jgi:uncharacterized membrane protein YfcA
VLSVPVVIFAALVYHQNGFVRLPVVGVIVTGFAVGAYCGARLVPHVPALGLRLGFGALLIYVGILFVFDIRSTRLAAALPAGVAAVFMAVLGRLLRRQFSRRPLPGPTPAATEYHI